MKIWLTVWWGDSIWIYMSLLFSFFRVQTLPGTYQTIISSWYKVRSKNCALLFWKFGIRWFLFSWAFSFHVPGNRLSCTYLQTWVSNIRDTGCQVEVAKAIASEVLRLLRDFLIRMQLFSNSDRRGSILYACKSIPSRFYQLSTESYHLQPLTNQCVK